ncbi:NAD(P)-dependent oxidoreductase [Acidiphilium sp.]|uniref:NAD(P)-dependent oxidoreductase n=1 Tax=Acidiphilium sp. TaxID=527 RepID=UPI003CFFBCC7
MSTIIFGASGGTGTAILHGLRARGEYVTAFLRTMTGVPVREGVTIAVGDATNRADVAAAMPGHDRVVISLGNSQNPFAMLLGAKRTTPRDICETGTRHIIEAMQENSITRVVCVTAFGVGATRAQAPLMFKIFYSLVLREHMADKERQEARLRASGLDWTLIQPVGLVDQPVVGTCFVSATGVLRKQTVSRTDLADAIIATLDDRSTVHQTIAVSG